MRLLILILFSSVYTIGLQAQVHVDLQAGYSHLRFVKLDGSLDASPVTPQPGFTVGTVITMRLLQRWTLEYGASYTANRHPFYRRNDSDPQHFGFRLTPTVTVSPRWTIGVGPYASVLLRRYDPLFLESMRPNFGLQAMIRHQVQERLSVQLAAVHAPPSDEFYRSVFGSAFRCGNGPHHDNLGIQSLNLTLRYRLPKWGKQRN